MYVGDEMKTTKTSCTTDLYDLGDDRQDSDEERGDDAEDDDEDRPDVERRAREDAGEQHQRRPDEDHDDRQQRADDVRRQLRRTVLVADLQTPTCYQHSRLPRSTRIKKQELIRR